MITKFKQIYPGIEQGVYIADSAEVIGQVHLDKDVSIWHGSVLRGDIQQIVIGVRSNIQELSSLHVNHSITGKLKHGESVIIGEDVTVGHRCILHACTVEDACLIGMGAIVLDGARIGKESIVAAGALVTKNKEFPPRSLVMGSPAKVIRELTEEEVASLYQSARNYVELKNEYL